MKMSGRKTVTKKSAFAPMFDMYRPSTSDKRIIKRFVGVRKGYERLGVREWVLHATKGWRNYRT